MKKVILLLLMVGTIVGNVNAKPKKSKQFEILLPTRFEVIDSTEFRSTINHRMDTQIDIFNILAYMV
jgi:hypothetical protein